MTARDDAMEEMRAALEPFAKAAANRAHITHLESDNWLVGLCTITYGDPRRAAKALASAQEKGEANG